MAKQVSPADTWRIVIWGGVADIVIGFGLAVAGLADLFGPDLEILALVGAIIAAVGLGIVLWGRKKLSEADNRRGDLN
ncbi:hypothetical protein GCM10009422_27130 [Brevundimonas kwangchunensis]|uniref:Uncharacterized protein n=1 Tax=Brevundimonas kwangchunensis TaxID=322163 RepID=A0ABN1H413_9CAUL